MNIIAQIGCGYWGPNLLRNFTLQPHCWVKWVVEVNSQRRVYVEENYPKTKVTSSLEEVLQDPEVEAIVIATPASTHYYLSKQSLQARKHILVEKPLAMAVAEADELVALATSTQRILMVGHTFLYNSAVHYLKQLVDKGELGQLYYIYGQRLNLGQVRTDVNAWWNLAPHDVSILLYLMNDELPVSVTAHGMGYIQTQLEDVVFATLTWSSGVIAHLHVSWLDPSKIRQMTIVGSRKMVTYNDVSEDKITLLDKGVDKVPKIGDKMDYDNISHYQIVHRSGDIFLPKIHFQEPLKAEAAHFLECIRTGKMPSTGGEHGRRVVAVLEAVQQALRGHQEVYLASIYQDS